MPTINTVTLEKSLVAEAIAALEGNASATARNATAAKLRAACPTCAPPQDPGDPPTTDL